MIETGATLFLMQSWLLDVRWANFGPLAYDTDHDEASVLVEGHAVVLMLLVVWW